MSWDALSFVRDYGISYWTEGKNVQDGWVNIRCPLCENDPSNHGGFNPVVGYYHCWRCGRHSLEWIISRLLNYDLEAVKSIIFEYSGRASALRKINKKVPKAKNIELPGEKLEKPHKRYLRKRGFIPWKIEEKYLVRGTGTIGNWKYRIIIPVYLNGQLVTYQGRDYTNKQQLRYKTLSVEKSVVDHRNLLYGIDNVPGSNLIGVVEGLFDQWRMGDGFVATFGTSMTEAQVRFLSRFKRILFLFDPEKEAQKKALKIGNKLSSLGCEVEIIDLEIDGDPAELSEIEANYIRKELGFGGVL